LNEACQGTNHYDFLELVDLVRFSGILSRVKNGTIFLPLLLNHNILGLIIGIPPATVLPRGLNGFRDKENLERSSRTFISGTLKV
jgi:hypothetical protein